MNRRRFVPSVDGLETRRTPSDMPGSTAPIDPGLWTQAPAEWTGDGVEGDWTPEPEWTGDGVEGNWGPGPVPATPL